MIKNILEFEKNNKLLEYKFKNSDILIWPLIRHKFYRDSVVDLKERSKKPLKMIKYIIESYFNRPSKTDNNYEIISFGPGSGNTEKIDGKFFNKYHDYYNLIYPKNTIYIETSDNMKYYKPRFFNNTYYMDYYKLKPYINYKIKSIFLDYDNYYDDFLKFLYEEFPIDFSNPSFNNLREYLREQDYTLNIKINIYRELFKKLKPKIIFLNTGFYGHESFIIKVAKDMGIKVAEIQHGVVSKNHGAYNYSKNIINSQKFKEYTPDYFLTFGKYWSDQINIPGKNYVLGNPHFHTKIKKYKNNKVIKNSILIISQWTLTEEFIKIANFLSSNMKNYKITFKAHPNEKKEKINLLNDFENVELIFNEDIYKLISQNENIVSCYSTALFEALAFENKILILDNDYSKKELPEGFGVRFKELHELKEFIQQETVIKNNYDVEYFFESNWNLKYRDFIENEINLKMEE